MKCVVCGRHLTEPTVEIPSRGGALGYGPVCARRAGLLPERSRRPPPIIDRQASRRPDPDQLTLELVQ